MPAGVRLLSAASYSAAMSAAVSADSFWHRLGLRGLSRRQRVTRLSIGMAVYIANFVLLSLAVGYDPFQPSAPLVAAPGLVCQAGLILLARRQGRQPPT